MSRRVICAFVFGVLSVVVLGAGVPAGAAPVGVEEKQVEIGEAQDRLQKIQTEASVSYENYDSALLGLNALDEKIEGSKRDLSQAENRMTEAQKSLEETAAQVYKSGNVGFIDVLVGSKDFDEFASRLELWVRLLAEERDRFEVVRDARDELQAEQAQLQEQRDDRVAALETALEEREQAESAASEAEEYLQSLSGDLQAEIEAAAARRAEEAQAAAEAALKDVEPAPAPKMVQVAQVAPDTSRADLRAEREAAEQRAAERAEKRAAAEAAAEEAERQAELAAKEAAKDEAAQQEAAQRRAEERRAEAAAARRAAEEAAVEQAAADRAAELAAQREAEQAAAEQAAAEQAAAEQAAAEQAAAEQAAVETTTPDNTVPETTPPAPEPAPAPATGGGSCGDTFGGVQPNVAEVGCLIRAQFGIQTIYGVRPGDPGDHGTGRALDIMTYSDVDTAYQVADYLLANMGQFGISYVITQQQINFGSGWEPMEDRGDPTQNHMDHVHVSFY